MNESIPIWHTKRHHLDTWHKRQHLLPKRSKKKRYRNNDHDDDASFSSVLKHQQTKSIRSDRPVLGRPGPPTQGGTGWQSRRLRRCTRHVGLLDWDVEASETWDVDSFEMHRRRRNGIPTRFSPDEREAMAREHGASSIALLRTCREIQKIQLSRELSNLGKQPGLWSSTRERSS